MATQTIADFTKNNPNYKPGWDPTTKTSSITDTTTGKSISFTSGQANDAYGITGQMQNGSNIIDTDKLMAALRAQANQGQQSQSMQPTQQAQAPNSYQTDAANMIEEQARQQMAAQAAAIEAARNKQVSEYNSQIEAAPQTYQPLRNQASFEGAKNLQAANERMAAQGAYNSGDNVTAGIQVGTATQNNINSLNLQEQNLVTQLKKAISDANESANSQTLQANSEINAQKLQALISQANADRDFNYQVDRNNVNDSRYADETAYNRSQDALGRTDRINESMGYVNPTASATVPDSIRQQLAQYSNDYSAYANANPNTELGYYARVLANEKMFNNPDLLAKYGEQFKTSAQKVQDLQAESQNLENEIKALQFERARSGYMTPQEKVEYETALFNLDQAKKMAPYDIQQAQLQLQNIRSQIANRSNGQKKSDSKPTYTVSQISSQANKLMNNKNADGTYIYTIGDVEKWLAGQQITDQQFDDIIGALEMQYPDRKYKRDVNGNINYGKAIGPGTF